MPSMPSMPSMPAMPSIPNIPGLRKGAEGEPGAEGEAAAAAGTANAAAAGEEDDKSRYLRYGPHNLVNEEILVFFSKNKNKILKQTFKKNINEKEFNTQRLIMLNNFKQDVLSMDELLF